MRNERTGTALGKFPVFKSKEEVEKSTKGVQMTEVSQSTLEQEMAGITSKFDQLVAKRNEEIEKGKVINQNISAISEEMVRLQGEYRVLERMKGNGKPPSPELTIPKKKPSKK